MHKIGIFLLVVINLLLCNGSKCQVSVLDSLQSSLKSLTSDQLDYSKTLIAIAKEISETNPDSALILIKQVKGLIEKYGYSELMSQTFLAKSMSFSNRAQYDSSIFYSYRALERGEIDKDTVTIIDSYNNLGIDFFYQDDFELAISYYQKVEQMSMDFGDTLRWAHVLNNIGMIYGLKMDYKTELVYYTQASILFQKINEKEGYGNTLLNTGTVYSVLGNYQKAEEYFRLALSIFEEIGYSSAIAQSHLNLSENHFAAGNNNLAKEEAYLALAIDLEFGFEQDELYVYELLKSIYKKTGEFKNALQYEEKASKLKEKIFNSEKSLQINNLQAKYQTKVKEDEIQRLTLVNELTEVQLSEARWQMAFILGGVILLASLAIFLYKLKMVRDRAERIEHGLRFEALQKRYIELLNGPVKIDLNLDQSAFNEKLTSSLSDREFEILKYSLGNFTNSEIADKVFVSVNTVKFHLRNIYAKLGVSNRKEVRQYIAESN